MEYPEQKWVSLAARLRAGEHSAAAELVDMYYQQIYLFMRRLGHSRQASEDLTQESFLQAWQHISQLRSDKALNSWLYRIASNVSRHHWRRYKDEEVVSIETVDIPSDTSGEEIGHQEQISRLKSGIEKLPRKLREAVVLHYMQYLTIAEAAEAAGVMQGTLKSRLNRALKALRKQIT